MNTTASPRRRKIPPALVVSIASLLVAAAGYGVLVVAANALGAAGYAEFSLFWAALYILVGMLFGLQQETTRAVRATGAALPKSGPTHLSTALISGLILAVLVLASVPLWSGLLRSSNLPVALSSIIVGVVLYSGHAAISGGLSGQNEWGRYSGVLVTEAALRLTAVAGVAAFALGAPAMSLASALPMGAWLLFCCFSPSIRAIGRLRTGASWGQTLTRHWKSMSASLASAILVTGFPLVLSFTATDEKLATLGAVILITTLARAPIMVPLNALMSMLVGVFVERRHRTGVLIARLTASILGVSFLLGIVAAWVGTWLIKTFFGQEFLVSPLFLAFSVVNAGLMGVMTVLGAAVLASGRHTIYALGWVTAAATTVVALLALPFPLEIKVATALAIGPVIGSAIQAVSLLVGSSGKLAEPSTSVS